MRRQSPLDQHVVALAGRAAAIEVEHEQIDGTWQARAALTGVAGSQLPISLGKPADPPRLDRPEPPIPVAASKLLVLEPREDGPLLKQANLCLIPAKP